MTETNNAAVNSEKMKEVTVKWGKFTDAVSLVFAGVISMLEAVDAKTARDILNYYDEKDNKPAREEDNPDASEKTGDGAVDDITAPDNAVADPTDAVEEKKPASKEEQAAPGITQDDITKIIVQKLKKDRTNNEKIGAILKTYGAAKVSELPAEKYEAFLTDLSEL